MRQTPFIAQNLRLQTNLHFKSVWNRRKSNDPSISSNSRDSIYNRIERISTGKGDSLMERYADRFGSDLDRRSSSSGRKSTISPIKPTVEVISGSTNNEMSLDEFIEAMEDSDFIDRVSEKTGVSVEKIGELDMDSMKSFFEQADIDNSGHSRLRRVREWHYSELP